MGDEYGGGVVAIADSVSGELVIVPSGVADDLEIIQWADDDAKEFCESYEKNGYSDYRLITKAEAVAILGNSALVSQLGLPTDNSYWTIEEYDVDGAYAVDYTGEATIENKTNLYYVLPVRKVNFYGLPLIESEFGGGLVYDVVAATRTVHVAAKPADWGDFGIYDWVESGEQVLSVINGYLFDGLPTRAQALKIFGNSYLVTLAGLPVDNNYWTSEDVGNEGAWYFTPNNLTASADLKTELYYALPVRSETV